VRVQVRERGVMHTCKMRNGFALWGGLVCQALGELVCHGFILSGGLVCQSH
jgi:hypothetical protein